AGQKPAREAAQTPERASVQTTPVGTGRPAAAESRAEQEPAERLRPGTDPAGLGTDSAGTQAPAVGLQTELPSPAAARVGTRWAAALVDPDPASRTSALPTSPAEPAACSKVEAQSECRPCRTSA